MKTEMYVVSSYEISPSCSVDSGFIRVGEKSSKTQRKSVYTMDEALAKLKRVLVSWQSSLLLFAMIKADRLSGWKI